MNEFDGITPIQNSAMEGKPISIRLYNFIIAALIFIGFASWERAAISRATFIFSCI